MVAFKTFVKIENFKFQMKNNVKFSENFQFLLKIMKIMKFMVPVGRERRCSTIALNPCIITKPLMKDTNGHMAIRMVKCTNNVIGDNLIPTGSLDSRQLFRGTFHNTQRYSGNTGP